MFPNFDHVHTVSLIYEFLIDYILLHMTTTSLIIIDNNNNNNPRASCNFPNRPVYVGID